jgi:hypothetical protein
VGRREGTLEDVVKTWQGCRVFLTRHTGFKGSWLALWLSRLGPQVRGYSLDRCTRTPTYSTWHAWTPPLKMFAAMSVITPSSRLR